LVGSAFVSGSAVDVDAVEVDVLLVVFADTEVLVDAGCLFVAVGAVLPHAAKVNVVIRVIVAIRVFFFITFFSL
jgi:hypothetical protein